MTNRRFVLAAVILLTASNILFAAQEPKVSIKKTEGRTEAVVGSTTSEKRGSKDKSIWRPFSLVEEGIMDVASTSSSLAGKGADVSVQVVQRVGGFLLSPFFRALDFVGRSETKQAIG